MGSTDRSLLSAGLMRESSSVGCREFRPLAADSSGFYVVFTRVMLVAAFAIAPRSERLATMCCLFASLALIGPRFVLVVWWIFGNRVDLAFGSWIWPLLGLVFLPWTTLAWVIAWQPVVGVDGGWDIALIVLGVALDLATYSSRAAGKRAGAMR